MKAKATEAYRLLNEFVGDLVAGVRILELFESPGFSSRMRAGTRTTLRRMCISHLILTLSKWAEFYDRYKATLPTDVAATCRDLRKEIKRRGIQAFRNAVVGHVWDATLKRPLTISEIDSRLAEILDPDQSSFLRWVNDPKANAFPNTVVSVCEYVRDRIGETHKLSESEVFG